MKYDLRRASRRLWKRGIHGALCLMLLSGLMAAIGSRQAHADATVSTWNALTTAFGTEASGSTVTLGGDIDQPSGSLAVPSGKSLILDLAGHSLSIKTSDLYAAAIQVRGGESLTIKDSVGNGTLTADARAGIGAGIGGDYKSSGGTITIESGTVSAYGGFDGAGIGGGQQSPNGGNVTINGGNVTAVAGGSSAGIGGSSYGSGGTVTINGGNVTAIGGTRGAGIGSGYSGASAGTVTINGGTVTATGKNGGAGIGGGGQSPGANVTITGGVVTVSGNGQGPPIGGTPFGSLVNSGTIEIASGNQLSIPAGVTVTNTGTIKGTVTGAGAVDGNNYTVKFDWNGVPQTNPASVTIYTASLAGAGKALPGLALTGYMLDGWYTQPSGGTRFTESSAIGGSMTLYAHYTSDLVAPTVALTASAGNTNQPFTVTAAFSEAVSGFANGDVTVTNGTAGSIQGSGDTYAFLVTPTADGPVTVKVAGGAAADAYGNGNAVSSALTVTYDRTAPAVALSTTASSPTNGAFTVTAQFSESVTDFAVTDIAVSNGIASSFSAVSGTKYTFVIVPISDGPVTVNVAGALAYDMAGNANTAASGLSLAFDAVSPTVTLSTTAVSPTNAAFTVTAQFSENVTGFAAADITVGNGTVGSFSAVSGSVYTFVITPTGEGIVNVGVTGGVAQDAAGNANMPAIPTLFLQYDKTFPTVTLSAALALTNAPFTVTAAFSESVTGFDAADIAVGNGTVGSFTRVDAMTYTFAVLPTADGEVTVKVSGAAAQDMAGNGNTASNQLSVMYDQSPPTVALGTTASSPTNGAFTVTAQFSESVTGFAATDIAVGNGTAGSFSAVSGSKYTFVVMPAGEGEVTVDVAGAVAQDAAGNANTAATQLKLVYDKTSPTLTLGTTAVSPTNAAFTVTAAFSENVTGFALADIAVRNGTASGFRAESGTKYTFVVTPTDDGPVTVDVAGGAAQDAAGNANAAAAQLGLAYDKTVPTVTLSTTAGNPTNAAFTVTAEFGENVTGFDVTDIAVGNGTAGGFKAESGTKYTFVVTPAGEGTVTVDVAAGAAQDAAGNGNAAAIQLGVTYDRTAPTLTLGTTAGNPTNGAFTVTAEFSESVTGFAATDIAVGNGTAGSFSAVSGSKYTFIVTPAGEGAVTVDVAQAVAQDAAGNANTAATQLSLVYDKTSPTLTLGTTAGNPTNAPFTVTAEFSENVTGFDANDVAVGNGSVGSFRAESGKNYTFVVTPSGDGAVTVDAAAGAAQDAAGNGNAAAPQLGLTYDKTAPTVTLGTAAGNPTNAAFTVTAEFGEDVTGFDVTDIMVGNGTAGSYRAESGTKYTFVVTPTGEGIVTVDVAAGAAQDAAGNGNAAATQLGVTYDRTAPAVALATTAGNPTNAAFTVTAEFSENVTGFDVNDITVGNGTAGGFRAESATKYTFVVTPTADGKVTVDVAGGAAQDAAGNGNAAAAQLGLVYDKTAPAVTLATTAGNPTNAAFTVTAELSEDVTGFDVTDVAVSNGSVGSFSAESATKYTFVVTPTADGTVKVDAAAAVAQDAAGNGNAAAPQLALTYDKTAPTMTLGTTAGNPTNGAFTVTAEFSEDVTGFDVTDITVDNGEAGGLRAESGTKYTFVVTPMEEGGVTVDVAGAVAQDAAGNANSAAEQLGLVYDKTVPTVTLSTTAVSPTNAAFAVTAEFSENVNGFDVTDIAVGNGEAGSFSAESGTKYTFVVTPTADGTVTVDVAGGAAQDAAGNGNAAAAQISLAYDKTGPAVTLATAAGNPTNAAFKVTAEFSEGVTGFDVPDILVGNGTAGGFSAESATKYTFVVTPTADGTVTVDVAGGAALDATGNENTAAAPLSLTYDASAPAIAFDPVNNADPAQRAESTVTVTDTADVPDLFYAWTPGEAAPPVEDAEWQAFSGGDALIQSGGNGNWYLHIHAVDQAGNAADATAGPYVLDNAAPVLVPNGDNPFYVAAGTPYAEPGAQATDNIDGALEADAITVSGEVDTARLGSYEIRYEAIDRAGNVGTATRIVHVYDGDQPLIRLNGDNPMIVALDGTFADPGATAQDAQEGDLTSAITVTGAVYTNKADTYYLTYDVKDAAGNEAPTVTRSVHVIAPPAITLLGQPEITIREGEAFADPGALATDAYYGDLTGQIKASGAVDPETPGVYTLRYEVTNPIGQSAEAVRTVTVESAPVIVPPVDGGNGDGGDGGSGDGGNGGSGPGGGGPVNLPADSDDANRINIMINGVGSSAEASTETTGGGRTVTRLRLTPEQTAGLFGASASAVIEVAGLGVDAVTIELPAEPLHDALISHPNAELRVIVDGNGLRMPLHVVQADAVVTVTIGKAAPSRSDALRGAISGSGKEALLDRPIEYTLQADGRAIEGWDAAYRERVLALPAPADADHAAVVWIDEHDAPHFVPAVFARDGKTATVYSPHDGLYTIIRTDRTFADVRDHWARADIELLANKLIVDGRPDGGFEPEASVTRAEFAALLVRALGLAAAGGEGLYTDVEAADWYAGAVGTAKLAGLIDGYGDGTFRPNESVTREQMATMIARALAFAGKSPEANAAALKSFADGTDIAAWAADAAAQLVEAGIMQGMAGTQFAPEAKASRAQCAVMLKRMLVYLQFINGSPNGS
ncbi:Ig-like domain-containing protein [Paenibacillus glycinis]|uniref:DUF5011 domain-containing protein n=1 Tax=Paenibacillus glycinis TaxID=2697035 RepID=A0ABW9XMY1_9BACL|nr:Ig-like domain-containing protein [Paenibacillus glycinis]NBD23898.1 DUF5011 domain-containing protein [Paenibacillus glycinis]